MFEPARPTGDLVRSRMGTGSVTATCRGRAAHAAQVPCPGRNAILALAEFLLTAAQLPAEFPGVLVNVGNIRGGRAAINVVPDFAQSEIDVRLTRVADRAPLLAPTHAQRGLHVCAYGHRDLGEADPRDAAAPAVDCAGGLSRDAFGACRSR